MCRVDMSYLTYSASLFIFFIFFFYFLLSSYIFPLLVLISIQWKWRIVVPFPAPSPHSPLLFIIEAFNCLLSFYDSRQLFSVYSPKSFYGCYYLWWALARRNPIVFSSFIPLDILLLLLDVSSRIYSFPTSPLPRLHVLWTADPTIARYESWAWSHCLISFVSSLSYVAFALQPTQKRWGSRELPPLGLPRWNQITSLSLFLSLVLCSVFKKIYMTSLKWILI